jgi:uncharacterized protein with HEPN domain
MSPRDLVYVGHMLDMARKAVSKVVHDYLGVDEDIVWRVVSEDLPKLVKALEPIVPPPPQQ